MPTPKLAVDLLECPTHCLDQDLRQSQPESGALGGALLGAKPVEGIEEPLQQVRRDPIPRVRDQHCEAVRSALFDRDRYGPSRPVVFDRVREQVQQNLLQPLLVGYDMAIVVLGQLLRSGCGARRPKAGPGR